MFASMRVTRSRTRQLDGNKTARSVLGDVSQNPQQQKKQKRQTRKKVVKPFEAAVDQPVEDSVPTASSQCIVAKPEWHSTDPQFVSEYMDDIMKCYQQKEARGLPAPDYLIRHFDINQKMREILVDWVVEVHHKFNLRSAVLYTTVQLIDRFLGLCTVARSKLQLVGITAMLISSKMEEIFPPQVKDFVYISDRAYTQEEIIDMEQTILNELKFQVAFPTMFSFSQQIVVATMSNLKTSQIASYLMDLTLQDYSALRFSPSMIASAAVNLATRIDRGFKTYDQQVWNMSQQQWIGQTEAQIQGCMVYLNQRLASPTDNELQAVKNKYSSSKWTNVAQNIQPLPAKLSLDELSECELSDYDIW